MEPLRIVETSTGNYSLLLNAGETPSDEAVTALDHEPNGYFWEGVAQRVAPELVKQVGLDSEGGMFCAYGTNRAVLEQLGAALAVVVNDPAKVRDVVSSAEADGFEFDD